MPLFLAFAVKAPGRLIAPCIQLVFFISAFPSTTRLTQS
jgi:hypothetical protein